MTRFNQTIKDDPNGEVVFTNSEVRHICQQPGRRVGVVLVWREFKGASVAATSNDAAEVTVMQYDGSEADVWFIL